MLSPPSLHLHMLAGASATSGSISSVVEDLKTVVGALSGAAFALELTITSACAATCEKVIGLRVGLYVLRQSVYRTNACFGLYQYCRRYVLCDLCSFEGPKAPLSPLAARQRGA